MPNSELREKRDELLRNAKKEKSEDYKAGYVDGALDVYNAAAEIKKKEGNHEV